MLGYRRSASSSYPGGTYTHSGRAWGSPSGFPLRDSLSNVCSSNRPLRSTDQGSIEPSFRARREPMLPASGSGRRGGLVRSPSVEEETTSTGDRGSRRAPDLGLILFLTPLIWGLTFPAGKVALERLSVPAFMAWSRTLGFLILLVSLPLFARAGGGRLDLHRAIRPGIVLGALLFLGYTLQTAGLARTTATNAGFITGLYVVFTPVLALVLLRQPTGPAAWAAVAISVVGLALLSVASLDTLAPRPGDLLVVASAVAWGGHVGAVGRFTGRYSSAGLALNQMAGASAVHVAGAV